MGAPPQITKQQVAELQAKTSGAPVDTRAVNLADGNFTQTFTMRQNDVYFVTLTRE